MLVCKKCSAELPDTALFCAQCGFKLADNKVPTRKKKTRGNGQGSVYKDGATWRAQVTIGIDENGKQIYRKKRGFKTKKEAIEYLNELRFKPQKDSRIKSLYEAITPQIEKLSKNKQSHYKTAYNRMTVLHNQKIEILSIQDLQTIVDEKCPTKYPAKDMRDLFSLIYQRAMAEQMVSVNLAKFIVLPDSEETETIPLNETEIEALWQDFADGHIQTGCFILMCYTGTMPGELFKITPSNIDLKNAIITGAGIKTEKRKQAPIIIPNIIVPVVQELIKDKPQDERLWKGDEKSFYDYFAEMKKRCRLREEIRPYSCRHTLATTLSNKNISTEVIKEVMRHAKLTTTEHYIHKTSVPLKEKKAVNKAFKKK